MAKVAVVMGSDSDLPTMKKTLDALDSFEIDYKTFVLSAHRSPEALHRFARKARSSGYSIIIAGAGGAAHLAGVISSLTTLPVIGVPMKTKAFKGNESFVSTLQMPAGVPVATMAVGEAGATNAAILAAEILALNDGGLLSRLRRYKKRLAMKVEEKQAKLRKNILKRKGRC